MTEFIQILQQLSPEVTSLFMLVVCAAGSLLLFRMFGLIGLYSYVAIAVVVANIQVLTATKFMFFPEPIAQGTIVFTSLFMVVNIITEHYGTDAARRAIWISFSSLLLLVCLMVLTLGWPQLDGEVYNHFNKAHEAVRVLFTPTPSLLLASLIAFVISQYNDIWIFNLCRKVTDGKFLWLRSNLANMFSGLVDNTIFSLLAWWIFAVEPLSFSTILYSYILGTYLLRVGLSILNTPFVYMSYYFKPKRELVLSYV